MVKDIKTPVIAALFAALFALVPATASAQSDEGLRALEEGDDNWLWRPVGRLDFGSGTCTGALVTYQHVVTAAHCVYDQGTKTLRDPGDITFRAGVRDGRAYASHRAQRIFVDPDFVYDDTNRYRRIASDIALIELRRPIQDKSVKPFSRHDRPHAGERVTVVSYGQGRNDNPAIEDRCSQLDRRGDILVYDCSTTFGSSGAPVFILSQSGPKLVSIVSSGVFQGGSSLTAAVALGDGYKSLIALATTPEPEVKRIGTGAGSLSGQLGRKSSSGLPQISQ